MCDGGGIKEKGRNPNMVYLVQHYWVGTAQAFQPQPYLASYLHYHGQTPLLILPYWCKPHPPFQPMRINTTPTWLAKSWSCPTRKRQAESSFPLHILTRVHQEEWIPMKMCTNWWDRGSTAHTMAVAFIWFSMHHIQCWSQVWGISTCSKHG